MLTCDIEQIKEYIIDKLYFHWVIIIDFRLSSIIMELYKDKPEAIELIILPNSIQSSVFLYKKTMILQKVLDLPHNIFSRVIGLSKIYINKSNKISIQYDTIPVDNEDTLEFIKIYINKIIKMVRKMSIIRNMKEYLGYQWMMKTLDIYSRLDDTMIKILRSLGNIYDDPEERKNLYVNITNATRKLKVIRSIVEKRGFDDCKEVINN